MGSFIPSENTFCSDEEETIPTIPSKRTLEGSKTDAIEGIKVSYNEDFLEGMDAADALSRHDLVAQWYEWCDYKYPGTKIRDWPDIALAAGADVDIRLLTRGYPVAGYAILLFLEACYAVDKALCGTDIEALAKVKRWHIPQEMKAYKYLLSDEMMLWWATELGELENEIKSPFSNRVSLSWRIEDLRNALARMEVVIECGEGIVANIWNTMELETGSEPPAGLDRAICNRANRLLSSVKILRKAFERSEQGDVASDILPSSGNRSVEASG